MTSSSNAPSSNAPSSNAPSSNAPSSNAPSSNAPSSNAPSSNAPSGTTGAGDRIAAEVGSWPGVEVDTGEIGELAFKVGPRELGHLHGDHAAHLFFAPDEWRELAAQDRVTHHPVFPTKAGPAAREIHDDADVADVITLFRLRYDRIVARHGLPPASAA